MTSTLETLIIHFFFSELCVCRTDLSVLKDFNPTRERWNPSESQENSDEILRGEKKLSRKRHKSWCAIFHASPQPNGRRLFFFFSTSFHQLWFMHSCLHLRIRLEPNFFHGKSQRSNLAISSTYPHSFVYQSMSLFLVVIIDIEELVAS